MSTNGSTATLVPEVSGNSSGILHKVLHESNMDAAFKILQDALGITSGDVAGTYCSKNELTQERWEKIAVHKRAEYIGEYLTIEAVYSQ